MGLATVFGAGGGTNSYDEFHQTNLILLVGSNAAEAHPIMFHHMMRGVRHGARLIVVDPRRTPTASLAHEHFAIHVGSDIALFNAMAHVIIQNGWERRDFIERATTGFSAFKDQVAAWTPERAEAVTGIAAARIEELARQYAQAPRALIGWTLGITEHHNAVDNVYSLINLALLTGHVGREGSGLNPLRGQNNVQGGGDMGALPNRLPGFQDLADPAVRQRFEHAWGVPLSSQPGWNQTEMFDAMAHGQLKGLYVIGENPLQSEANVRHVREIFGRLKALVVQDIFMTQTAQAADVVFPAAASFAESEGTYTNSERRVQHVRPARRPPGQAKDDLDIVVALARAMGHDWSYRGAQDVFEEIRQVAPMVHGMTYDRIDQARGLQWPCPEEHHPGTRTLHTRLWDAVVDPKVPFMPVDWTPPVEVPDGEYPFLLSTGRRLAFYNTGVQSNVYDHPHNVGEWMEIHPVDAKRIGVTDGDVVRVISRRGQVEVPVRVVTTVNPGTVFMTFHFPDQVDTNVLSIDAVDPQSGTAEFKAAAVRIERREKAVKEA